MESTELRPHLRDDQRRKIQHYSNRLGIGLAAGYDICAVHSREVSAAAFGRNMVVTYNNCAGLRPGLVASTAMQLLLPI